MITTINQFRVTFKTERIEGLREAGTIWYDVNFFDAENIIKKYENEKDFQIITRQITKDSNAFKNYKNAKSN